jgi:hypothetical protein
MMRTVLSALAVGSTAVCVGACGSAGSPRPVAVAVGAVGAVSPAATVTPMAVVTSPLKAVATSDPSIGAQLVPAPASAQPLVSASAALATYQSSMPNPEWSDANRSVSLVVYSNASYGPVDAAGKVTPAFTGVLSWAINYRHVPVLPIGGAVVETPGPAATPTAASVSTDCDFVYLVDAKTGGYMMAFNECPGRI